MMCRLYSHLRYANRWGTDQDTTLPAPGTGERGMDRWNEQAARQQFITNFADYFHDHLKQIAGDMSGLSGDELEKVGKEVEAEVNDLAPTGWFDAAFPGDSGKFLKDSDKSKFCSAMQVFIETVKDRLKRDEERDQQNLQQEMESMKVILLAAHVCVAGWNEMCEQRLL